MERMKKAIPKYALFILLGIITHILSDSLQSDFISQFVDGELVTLLVALLAINLTTNSIILAKLQELAALGRLDHSKVIKEMRLSVKEQVTIIVFASILLIMSLLKKPAP